MAEGAQSASPLHVSLAVMEQRVNSVEALCKECHSYKIPKISDMLSNHNDRVHLLEQAKDMLDKRMENMEQEFKAVRAWLMATAGGVIVSLILLVVNLFVMKTPHVPGAIEKVVP